MSFMSKIGNGGTRFALVDDGAPSTKGTDSASKVNGELSGAEIANQLQDLLSQVEAQVPQFSG